MPEIGRSDGWEHSVFPAVVVFATTLANYAMLATIVKGPLNHNVSADPIDAHSLAESCRSPFDS